MSVVVLEAKGRPGGAVWSDERTLPGFLHDVGAAFFPFGTVSPALVPLALDVPWKHARFESAHPAPDGSCAAIARDLDASMGAFGRDAERWRELHLWHAKSRATLLPALLGALPPSLGVLAALSIDDALTFASLALASGRSFASRFETEAARRVVPGLGLHADVGPDDPLGAAVGLMLALLASSSGFPVPVGGARAITNALLARLAEHGGTVRLDAHVDRIVVREGRAVAVETSSGDVIEARRAIIADVGAPALYLDLLDEAHVPWLLRRAMKRYPYAWGTFKVDWALSGPVPWRSSLCRDSAVVHLGDSVDDLARFTREVRDGGVPSNPYLVIGQQSLVDATRAPAGCHTLYAYTHAPSTLASGGENGGWHGARESFADALERRIEEQAPGFRGLVLARSISAPPDLEAMDENLVGGDLGGGTAAITNQLVLRPAFPWFRHRTPVRGLYLGSSFTHPGTGVHGMCGFLAAKRALADMALRSAASRPLTPDGSRCYTTDRRSPCKRHIATLAASRTRARALPEPSGELSHSRPGLVPGGRGSFPRIRAPSTRPPPRLPVSFVSCAPGG